MATTTPYDAAPYATAFAKMIPGFDFLEGLVKNAGSTLPQIGQWVAPTLDPEELEKRINELRTVQFWLEQNARMLGATIQALEVQRMTLSTLKTMNVQMTDLRDTLTARPGEKAQAAAAQATPPRAAPPAAPAEAASSQLGAEPAGTEAEGRAAGSGDGTPAVDPMQWWGALTQQFSQLATSAMKDTAAGAAKNFAGALPKTAKAASAPVATKPAVAPAPAGKKAAPRKAARKRRPAAAGKA